MNRVTTITALGDNYIYLYQYAPGSAFVIDPGDSKPVFPILETRSLTLSAVLVTHGHFDHCGGARDLKNKTDCEIIGPDRNGIPGIDRIIKDAETIEFNGTKVQVIAAPGHTATSVCYYIPPTKDNPGILFTGDTLFTGGCGRIFECSAKTMWNSLKKIAALPKETLVYPGHNYTKENYQFALTIDPQNQAIKNLLDKANFAPPSTIAQEKQTNIFLQANTPQIKKALETPKASDSDVFAKLRQKKDTFG